jgi:hypothetical protein
VLSSLIKVNREERKQHQVPILTRICNWVVPVNEALLAEHDIVVDEAKFVYGYTADMSNPISYLVIKWP